VRICTKDWIEPRVDDAPLGRAQLVEKRLRHVERAGEVDRHDVLPVLGDGVQIGSDGVAPRDAGIVDQDRSGPEPGGDLAGDGAAGFGVGDVEREGHRLEAFAGNLGGGLFRRLSIDVENGKAGALARKANRDGAADAGARAGDGGDVGGEEVGHGRFRARSRILRKG